MNNFRFVVVEVVIYISFTRSELKVNGLSDAVSVNVQFVELLNLRVISWSVLINTSVAMVVVANAPETFVLTLQSVTVVAANS